MLLFRAWWRRGEKEHRGVEIVSSCILLVLPPYKTNAVVLRVLSSRCLGQVGIWLCSGAGWPPLPRAPWKCGLGPSAPRRCRGSSHPPDWLLCLKLPEENSCCTVLLLSWEMLTWNPLAVVVQLVRRSLRWLLGDLGVGWAGGEQPLPSFLGSGWNICRIPFSSRCLTGQSQVTERTSQKRLQSSSGVFRGF